MRGARRGRGVVDPVRGGMGRGTRGGKGTRGGRGNSGDSMEGMRRAARGGRGAYPTYSMRGEMSENEDDLPSTSQGSVERVRDDGGIYQILLS
ncbi:hypothetical protein PENTCL1PPCAC_24648 [Pristionchus entomophagus]|uniref:Uncharacterized protein n=1 Tax=Pristionchus entomophagus TaxID=358040 RepID=A0AAV5U7T8_9BILA|nr:hypothetical protein PENTCL1PPCAC_24648 [Pristionchus entomophagus]